MVFRVEMAREVGGKIRIKFVKTVFSFKSKRCFWCLIIGFNSTTAKTARWLRWMVFRDSASGNASHKAGKSRRNCIQGRQSGLKTGCVVGPGLRTGCVVHGSWFEN